MNKKFNSMDCDAGRKLIKRITGAKTIVTTTHEGADGDGIGCELALYYALKKQNKNVYIINVDPVPKRLFFLDEDKLIQIFNEKNSNIVNNANLIIVLDASSYKRTGRMENILRKNERKVFFIDHHIEEGNNVQGIFNHDRSSTGEIVYELLSLLKIPFCKRIAECLYEAILFDTHSFRYIKNDPNSLIVAAELIKHGVDTDILQEKLFATKGKDQIKLLSYVYSNLNYLYNGKLVWTIVNKEIIDSLDVDRDEVRGIISNLIEIAGVQVAILFKVFREGEVKVSFRSKAGFSVGNVAVYLGGGGHHQAAGAEINGKLEDVIKKVLSCFHDLKYDNPELPH